MRPLNSKEEELLSKLLDIAGLESNLSELKVTELKDGEMGSLAIGENYKKRSFGKQVAEYQFTDLDGIEVSCTLNLDTEGNLYELDIFKADFSPLKELN